MGPVEFFFGGGGMYLAISFNIALYASHQHQRLSVCLFVQIVKKLRNMLTKQSACTATSPDPHTTVQIRHLSSSDNVVSDSSAASSSIYQ